MRAILDTVAVFKIPVVDGGGVGEQRRGDHRSPRVFFSGTLHSQRPVIAATVQPPISFRHVCIQLVVDLPQRGDEALFVNVIFLGGERFAAAELFD
jgi:hypothetical protein